MDELIHSWEVKKISEKSERPLFFFIFFPVKNGSASPRHDTVDPMLLPLGNPFKCHEDVLSLQPMIPP